MQREISKIGTLFHFYRKRNKLSREQFCKDVCSSKYVYLIEKGERTPSIQIFDAFSFKYGLDFTDYLLYIDYGDPFEIKDLLDLMDQMMIQRDFEALARLNASALTMDEFKSPPLSYRISYNNAWLLANQSNALDEAIELISDSLEELGHAILTEHFDNYSLFRPVIRGHALLATCNIRKGLLSVGIDQLAVVYNLLLRRRAMHSLESTFISVALNYAYALTLDQQYIQSKAVANELLSFQKNSNRLECLHITFFILGHTLYHMAAYDECLNYLQNCRSLALVLDCFEDLKGFSNYDSMQWAFKEEDN